MGKILVSVTFLSLLFAALLVFEEFGTAQLFWVGFVLSGLAVAYRDLKWRPVLGLLQMLSAFFFGIIISWFIVLQFYIDSIVVQQLIFSAVLGAIGLIGHRAYWLSLVIWLVVAGILCFALEPLALRQTWDETGAWKTCILMYAFGWLVWVKGGLEYWRTIQNHAP